MKPSPDVDRGWAFMVIIGYFFFRFLALGLTLSPAIFFSTFLAAFEGSPVMTAWAVNLNTFVIYTGGEVANALIRRIGCRRTIVVGCVLSSVGLMVTAFAPNLIFVFVFYGCITGLGYAMINIALMPIVAQYFVKYRRVVFLLASSGLAIGQFLLPPLIQRLSEAFSWRGAVFLLAGLNLNFFVVAAIFMPVRVEASEPLRVSSGQLEVTPEARAPRKLPMVITNLKLCRYPRFSLYCIGGGFCSFGFSGLSTHVKNFMCILGHSEDSATVILSLMGLCSLISSIAIGAILVNPRANILVLYLLLTVTCGLCIGCFSFLREYQSLLIVTVVLGLSLGFWSTFPEVIIALVGLPHLATGLSYAGAVSGIGTLLGGPVAAFFFELDPSYTTSFSVASVVSTGGALLTLPSVLGCGSCKDVPEAW